MGSDKLQVVEVVGAVAACLVLQLMIVYFHNIILLRSGGALSSVDKINISNASLQSLQSLLLTDTKYLSDGSRKVK